MQKTKYKHGPLYEHAKKELEKSGLSNGKGLDQTIFNSTLRLIDTYERSSASPLAADTIAQLFDVLRSGGLINPPTNYPGEWRLEPGLRCSVNVRCPDYRSDDHGKTWRHVSGATGISIDVSVKESDSGSKENKTNVQSADSK